MGRQNQEECMFCGQMAEASFEGNHAYHFVECPVCGRYYQQIFPTKFGIGFKDEIASYLYYSEHSGKKYDDTAGYVFLGPREEFEQEKEEYPMAYYASEDEVKAFYPRKFTEKLNRILLGLADKSSFIGDVVKLTYAQTISAFFIKRFDEHGKYLIDSKINNQLTMICDYLDENNFVVGVGVDKDTYNIILGPEGWKRVDELQQQRKSESNTVFVAMSFANDMKETRETIKMAITANNYVPRIMDEIEHNHQIVPEMLYEIRESRFVIAELTGHNNGAYFEAGYALGCGKEVIQVCNKEKFSEDGHFDVKQINTVMWENQDDLFARLNARIKATIS